MPSKFCDEANDLAGQSSIPSADKSSHPVGGEFAERLLKHRRPDNVAKRIFHDDEYWLTTLFSLKGRAFPLQPLVVYVLYSTAITAAVVYGMSPDQRSSYAVSLGAIQGLLSALLGLLMAFRVNQAFNRWWDGCKAWELVRNGCTIIARHAHAYINDKNVARTVVGYASVFPRVLKMHVQQSREVPFYEGELTPSEIGKIITAANPPLLVLGKISETLGGYFTVPETPRIALLFENYIATLNMAVMQANTIITTPVPFAYLSHLRTIVVLFLACLPLVYAVTLKWYCIIACGFFGFAWLGLETTSVEIESPFGVDYNDLPLEFYNKHIHLAISNWPDVAPSYKNPAFMSLRKTATDRYCVAESAPSGREDSVVASQKGVSDSIGAPTKPTPAGEVGLTPV